MTHKLNIIHVSFIIDFAFVPGKDKENILSTTASDNLASCLTMEIL